MDKDITYVRDMLENIHLLESFLQNVTKDVFLGNLEKQFASARALEIIGEASGKLSEEFKNNYPEVDWRGIKAMRNLLIHEYAYVDAEEVWKAYESDIPPLKEKLQRIPR